MLGRMRSELEYAGIDDLAANVGPTVERLQAACVEASELLDTRFFRRTSSTEWHAGMAS